MTVPCGKCINCRIAHSREWAVRIIHEMGEYENNCWFTLTYDQENLPSDNSLSKRDCVNFFKRLRKSFDFQRKFKYYLAGEYGEINGRPHYHVIALGLGQRDKEKIEKAWGKGIVHIGTVTYDSARYTADYIQKKYSGNKQKLVYGERQPPFQLQSLKIGEKYALDNAEQIKKNLNITYRGQNVGIPRYYKKKLGLDASVLGEQAKKRQDEINEQYKKRVEDIEDIPSAVRQSAKQRNRNTIARINIKNSRKQNNDRK